MEPFVPEPEERINSKDAGAKPPARNSGKRSVDGPAAPARGKLATVLPAAAVAIVLGGYILASNAGREDQMAQLQNRVDELGARIAAASEPGPRDEEQAAPQDSGFADRLGKLEKLVATQVSDLDTMRIMVAETLSKLDADLEGSLLNYYQRNRKSIEQLEASLTGIDANRTSLAAVQKDVESLAQQIKQRGDAQQAVQVQLTSLEEQVAAGLAGAEQQARLAEQRDQRLAQVQTELAALDERFAPATLTDNLKQQGDGLAALDSRVSDDLTNLRSTLDSRISAEDARQMVASLTEQAVAPLAEQVSALTTDLATAAGGDDLASVRQRLTALGEALDNKVAAADISRLESAVKAELATLQKHVARLNGGQQEQLASQLSGLREQLAAKADGDALNAVRAELAAMRQPGGASGDSQVPGSAALTGDVQQLQLQLAALADSVAAARGELATSKQQYDRLAQQVAAKGNASTASGSAATVPEGLEAALADLQARQNAMSGQLAATGDQLEKVSGDLAARLARVEKTNGSASASVPSTAVDELRSQVLVLANQVNQSRSRLASFDTRVEGVQNQLEQKIAATNVSLYKLETSLAKTAPAVDSSIEGQVEAILETIQVLKKQHPYAAFDH